MMSEPLTIIRASAGSGKTYQLVKRMLELLVSGAAGPQICATTFTRKAAFEIQERLLKWLADGALGKPLPVFDEPRSAAELRVLLEKLVLQEEMPRIGTIDSLISDMGRLFAFELGLPENWRIAEEGETNRMIDRAVIELLSAGESGKIGTLASLIRNDRSIRSVHRAIRKDLADALGLWREGAGDVEGRPAVWAFESQTKRPSDSEWQVASDALRAAPAVLIKSGEPDKTYAKARQEILRAVGQRDLRGLLGKGLFQCVAWGDCRFAKKPVEPALRSAIEMVVSLVRRSLEVTLSYKSLAFLELLAWFDRIYFDFLAEDGAVSFDDLKELLLTGMREEWRELLAFRLGERFEHLIFDEFQDTAVAQWRFFAHAPGEIDAQRGNSLFVVGDPKQSIYGWRGGVKELFMQLATDVESCGGKVRSLTESRRSAQSVLDSVNILFAKLPELSELKGRESAVHDWLQFFDVHRTHHTELTGQVAAKCVKNSFESELVASVLEVQEKHPELEIGILVRSNKRLRSIARAFERHVPEIPVSQEGGGTLLTEPIVRAVLSILKMIDHPEDTVARYIVAHSIFAEALKYNDWENAELSVRVIDRLRAGVEEDGLFLFIEKLLRSVRGRLSADQIAASDVLLELALQHEARIAPRVAELASVAARAKFQRSSGSPIRLLTAHQAKGLEFDVVFLAECEFKMGGRPPSYMVQRGDPREPPERIRRYEKEELCSLFPDLKEMYDLTRNRHLSEDLSILYVMMTRAKRGLFLMMEGGKRLQKPTYQKLFVEGFGLKETDEWQQISGNAGLYL